MGAMKGGFFSMGFTALVLVLTLHEVSAMVCERELAFGFTQRFTCPQPTDDKDKVYCCGSKENRFCCDTPFGLDEDMVNQVVGMLPTILTVIGVFILVIIIVCIVCCCCCPFCLLHKRRNRGAVHHPTTTEVTVTQPLQPMQPMHQPYPNPQPYPPQPYPPQPYPQDGQPQPYPPQGQPYPPQGGYPTGYPQQPYPQPGMYPVDQPPPYSEKQLPYNPNYQQ